MKMMPAKTKHKKSFKGKIHGKASAGAGIQFGSFGLKSLKPERMTAEQMESARKVISKAMKRTGKFWNRVFPHMPVSGRSADSRMGGGKGAVAKYVAKIYPGTMLFEVKGVSEEMARNAFSLAAAKLPCLTEFVIKEEGVHVEYA